MNSTIDIDIQNITNNNETQQIAQMLDIADTKFTEEFINVFLSSYQNRTKDIIF